MDIHWIWILSNGYNLRTFLYNISIIITAVGSSQNETVSAGCPQCDRRGTSASALSQSETGRAQTRRIHFPSSRSETRGRNERFPVTEAAC